MASEAELEQAGEDEIKKLKQECEESKKQAEDYLTRLKYLQAEFENYKKRTEKERAEIIKSANEALILKLLDVYENLERALQNKSADSLHEGVGMIYRQMKEILEKGGLRPIPAVGEKFDPFRHEAVMQEVREDCEEGAVLEEFQRGYMLNDKVLRYSKVKVSVKQKEKEE